MGILNTGFFSQPVSLSRLALYFLTGLGVLLLVVGALFFTDLARLERSITTSTKTVDEMMRWHLAELAKWRDVVVRAKIPLEN